MNWDPVEDMTDSFVDSDPQIHPFSAVWLPQITWSVKLNENMDISVCDVSDNILKRHFKASSPPAIISVG